MTPPSLIFASLLLAAPILADGAGWLIFSDDFNRNESQEGLVDDVKIVRLDP